MKTFVQCVKAHLTRPVSAPRRFPTEGFSIINTALKVEEENWEWYTPQSFYPVQIGEVFRSRYQVLGKLGYGGHSTAWLCRDLHKHKYVTVKVCECNSLSARRELDVYRHLETLKKSHSGTLLIRQMLDTFTIPVPHGEHVCLVHEPLGMSIETFRQLMPNKQLGEDVLKALLRHLLRALDYLHNEGGIVHTDLQARNVHMRVEDESILKDFEDDEMKHPSARKFGNDYVVYESRGIRMPKRSGRPILCDFGEARYGKESYQDDIQPYVYRAPEVLLDIPWNCKADIWNLGVMTWDLFQNAHLFTARGPDGDQSIEYHLAEMIAILGPPPPSLLERSETSRTYFGVDGDWIAATQIPKMTLETSEQRLTGKNQDCFLSFIRKMLRWVPESRSNAKELLEDPWLRE